MVGELACEQISCLAPTNIRAVVVIAVDVQHLLALDTEDTV